MPIPRIVPIAAATAAAMVFASCADRSTATETAHSQAPGYRRAWSDDDVVKPDWLANPTRDGTVIAAWGSTPDDPFGGRGAMRDKALDQARRELARMVMVRVESALRDYLSESNGGMTAYTESVSRTIAIQSIRASYQQAEWVHPKTGELFIWAVANPAFAAKLAQSVADTAATDPAADAHTRAKLESDKGFAELDRTLEAAFSKTGR